jgi:hypothetical protein
MVIRMTFTCISRRQCAAVTEVWRNLHKDGLPICPLPADGMTRTLEVVAAFLSEFAD